MTTQETVIPHDAMTTLDRMTESALNPERAQVLRLVERHGWNATAFQTLEPGYSYAFYGSSCVAYVDTGAAWVVAGAPLADLADLSSVAMRFAADARSAGKRCCFFGVEERFREATGAAFRSFCVGEQPVYDPRAWAQIVRQHSSLRAQLQRATNKGVRVRELGPGELESKPVRAGVESLARRWLAARSMAPLGFLVQLELFQLSSHRRCFVAELAEEVVGFAALVPVPARPGFLLEDLLRAPEAPNGTSELLVHAAMSWANTRGCRWLTLGLSPLAGEVPEPLRLFRRASFLYDFEGLRAYKAKLKPCNWSNIFVAYPRSQRAPLALLDVLQAFSEGSLLRFAARSLFSARPRA